MQVTCPECAKKLNVAQNLAGKKIRCPNCKAVLPVPTEQIAVAPATSPRTAPAAFTEPPLPADKPAASTSSLTMRCAACKAVALKPLPPNRFSQRPGYSCSACGKIMRPPGTTGTYIIVVILGGFVFLCGAIGSVAILLAEGIRRPVITGTAFAVVLGASAAAWAIKQLTLPVPLDAPKRPIRIWVVLVILSIMLLLGCLMAAGFFGFAYFLHEM
jgi:hypothetical protein